MNSLVISRLVPKFDECLEYDRSVEAGDVFRHFKGGVYQVVGVATHSETREKLVVYQPLIPDKDGEKPMCMRPLEMFMSEVDHEKYPDVKQPYRMMKMEVKKR